MNREFDPSWNAVANAWARVSSEHRDNHFFATLDFDNGQTTFQKVHNSICDQSQFRLKTVFPAWSSIRSRRLRVSSSRRSSRPGQRKDHTSQIRFLQVRSYDMYMLGRRSPAFVVDSMQHLLQLVCQSTPRSLSRTGIP